MFVEIAQGPLLSGYSTKTASIDNYFGSSGFCVGALQIPPLCKGRHGGVEASRGWVSREVLGSCEPASFLPPHAPPYKGGDSLGNHRCPSKNPHDFRKCHYFQPTEAL
jgi:hypothetical protein